MVRNRRHSNENGAGIAEAVLATPLFVILVIAALQLLVIAWRAVSVQFIATQVMREVTRRECGMPPDHICTNDEIRDYAKARIEPLAKGHGIFDTATNPALCVFVGGAGPDPCTSSFASNVGAPGQIAAVVVEYSAPLLGTQMFQIGEFSTGIAGPIQLRGVAIGLVERRRDQ